MSAYLEYVLMGVILIPGILFAVYAQIKVSSSYNQYSNIKARSGITATQAARMVLDGASLEKVKIKTIPGNLTDHYDPRTNEVALSSQIANSSSIAALGIALHEVGHAIQHNKGYSLAKVRLGTVKFSSIVSQFLWPLVFLGILLNFAYVGGVIGQVFIWLGVAFWGLIVLVNLVTLPVEYDASNRALKILEATEFLEEDELPGCKKVLRAAGLTYVAALLVAILNLLRFVFVFGRRRD